MKYIISEDIIENGLHAAEQKALERKLAGEQDEVGGENDVMQNVTPDDVTTKQKKARKDDEVVVDETVVNDMYATFEKLSDVQKTMFTEKIKNEQVQDVAMSDVHMGEKKGKKNRKQNMINAGEMMFVEEDEIGGEGEGCASSKKKKKKAKAMESDEEMEEENASESNKQTKGELQNGLPKGNGWGLLARDFLVPNQMMFGIRNQSDLDKAHAIVSKRKDYEAIKKKALAIAKRKGLKCEWDKSKEA